MTHEEITTIFVVGFPDDIREREFCNLFMFSRDFEGAILKIPVYEDCESPEKRAVYGSPSPGGRKQTIGFAKFRTQAAAINAIEVLNGRRVDAERCSLVMKAELAKKNLISKRSSICISDYVHPPAPNSGDFGPGRLSCPDYYRSGFQLPGTIDNLASRVLDYYPVPKGLCHDQNTNFSHPRRYSLGSFCQEDNPFSDIYRNEEYFNGSDTEIDNGNYSCQADSIVSFLYEDSMDNEDLSRPEKQHVTETRGIEHEDINKENTSSHANVQDTRKGPKHPMGENPPCNTLYVGNLPGNVSEEELISLFHNHHGYKRLSFKAKANGPMCFVEFEDVGHATQAMNDLYGTVLSSSTKGGIRLSYSKNPLGVKPNTQKQAGYRPNRLTWDLDNRLLCDQDYFGPPDPSLRRSCLGTGLESIGDNRYSPFRQKTRRDKTCFGYDHDTKTPSKNRSEK